MPKRTDIKSILLIGSGPIVIGQACEFDYSGTQACKALKADGYEVPPLHSSWPLTGEADLHERHGGRLMSTRSACAMGHKWLWNASLGGYPSNDFLKEVDPLLDGPRIRASGPLPDGCQSLEPHGCDRAPWSDVRRTPACASRSRPAMEVLR